MTLKTTYIINYNFDKTITIYDIRNDLFYELNLSASIAFENIDKSTKEIANIFCNVFENGKYSDYVSDIESIKIELLKFFE